MARLTYLYDYVKKYIQAKSSNEFKEHYMGQLKAFLYMNVANKRDADKAIYGWCEDLFFEYKQDGQKNSEFNKEFKDLVIGCFGNMKEVYGNNEICNFDEAYKILTHNPNANLDKDYKKLDKKYISVNLQNVFVDCKELPKELQNEEELSFIK